MNKMVTLGDLLGPLTCLGKCPLCDKQHMSTHARVRASDRACERCVAPACDEGRADCCAEHQRLY